MYPKEFNSDYIYAIEPNFTDSLSDIIERSGRKNHIIKMLEQRLSFLEERKHSVFEREWFEKPKKYKGIYFIHIKDENLNIRISFIFYTYEKKQYAVLLSVFTETKKSTAKTDSYGSHVPTIIPIINNMEEVFKHGL